MPTLPVYYSPEDVARRLRVTPRTIYTWLRAGRLPARRAGRLWRIDEEGLRTFLAGTTEALVFKRSKPSKTLLDYAGCLVGPTDLGSTPDYLVGFGE